VTLSGKRIVVLGGSSGIGLATAQAADRLQQERSNRGCAGHTADRHGGSDLGPCGRGRNPGVIRAAWRLRPLGFHGRRDFAAGETLQLGTLATTDVDAARRFFTLRYWGAYCAAKYGSSSIRKGGSIVFTSGIAGQRPRAGWALGASICAAMEGLTRALAVELAPVRVNIVSPGVVRTPLWANMAEADRGALYQQETERLPVGHVGDVAEIAEAYLYLMRQSYSTGQVLVVDGGAVLV
jgi:NAD(P)-dependent dehydrogenase (short-subunit alcohol dehydrogenase family)